MKRILCIQLPDWSIQRLRAARPELEKRPLVLRSTMGGVERVFACSHEAAALGVLRRQPIAEVMGLGATGDLSSSRALTVFPHDPDADRAALLQWAERCGRFSPLVGVDDSPQPDSLLMDIAATAQLFGGEEALAQEAVAGFNGARLQVRAAIADTPAGAWAVAHFHPAFLIQRSPLLRIAPGETPGALRLLPIESLRLPERTVAILHELGVDLIGQLVMLPRKDISSRFGPELLCRLDQAVGARSEPILAVQPQPAFAASWESEQPTRRRETIHAAMEQVVEQLMHALAAAGRGAIRIECRFNCTPDSNQSRADQCRSRAVFQPGANAFSNGVQEATERLSSKVTVYGAAQAVFSAPCEGDSPIFAAETEDHWAKTPFVPRKLGQSPCERLPSENVVRFSVGLFRPTVDAKHVLGLLHLKLEREQLAGPVAGIEVAALETGPFAHRQMPLFAGGSAGHDASPGGEALERHIEQLSSRLGREAVVSVRLLPDAQPERAWRGKPLIDGPRRRRRKKTVEPALSPSGAAQLFIRPLTLFSRPVAIRVTVHGAAQAVFSAPCEGDSPIFAAETEDHWEETPFVPRKLGQSPRERLPLRAVPDMHIHGGPPLLQIDSEIIALARIDFEGEEHHLAGSWGPERIETGWWRGRQVARDYYLVETTAGRRLWLFRQLDTGRWFVHGAFD